MGNKNTERIAIEFCDSFRDAMLRKVAQFPMDWNGLHVRAMAQRIVSENRPMICRAMEDIAQAEIDGKIEMT